MLLKEHVDKAADPKAELDGIVKRIKSNNNRETPPALPVSPGRCGRQHAGAASAGCRTDVEEGEAVSVGLRPTACELTRGCAHCSGQEQGAGGNRAGGARGRGGRGERC